MYVLGISILFIIIWLVLDFRLGRKYHLSLVRQVESSMLYSHFEVFGHGKELFNDFFNSLYNAEKEIHVMFYIVKDDVFSKEFLSILKAKACEGIEVRLLIDRLGSLKVKKDIGDELSQAGVQVAFSDRIEFPFLFYSANVRNHRKISVIDGKIGYLGGYNIGQEYIDEGPQPLNPWRDYHLKMTGEGVHLLQNTFQADWERAAKKGRKVLYSKIPMGRIPAPIMADMETSAELTYPVKRKPDGIPHQLVPTEADQLEEWFRKLIQMAEKEMIIGTPYFIPSRRILDELLAALKRGVKLTVIVPYTSDHVLVQEASYRYFRKLLREGAFVYQYKNGFYHAKTIVIDDKICDIGTANFDKRSLYLNKEINCYIYDSQFIARFKNILEKDIKNSEMLTLDSLDKMNPVRLVKEGAAYCISYFL
ncbi:cardiolipin synthase [Neobacillus mesonae]|uniref:cardiolipin synthase n=1 Tax=Neobacillus mesonae TaxID=1193713 RepID=UPI00203BD6E2|nr:cardiolipin synthase [Neobacillus mesonae]MCM3567160.1 cardiolipin synthase [Neobacillus mesonae]